jgi:ADP-ribose pyrophosphatase
METWISSKRLYRGKVLSLRVGNVRLDDGGVATREVIEHPGGVAVVPVRDGKVTLISEFRIAIGREIVELPGGRLEDPEPASDCARRELAEELGYVAHELVFVSSYYTSAGFTNERMHLFLAFQLERGEPRPEHDEVLRVIELPLAEVEAKLWNHEFEDARTIIGLHELVWYLRQHPELAHG